MPRLPRVDAPGLLHHVVNRGLARRTIFETRRDVRVFLTLLALEVRAGRIEVLAYSILTTHFHLLVRSRTGELDRVMQRVLNTYVRYFNRRRRRDGSLFRGRYWAKPVRSIRYRTVLIRYIDQNAVQARLAVSGSLYPYGSASLYVARRRPRWLDPAWVDEQMGNPTPEDRPAAYQRTFGRLLSAGEAELVERRLEHAATSEDDWDSLIGAAPPRVLDWMIRKARLADGTKPGLPYASAARVVEVVQEEVTGGGGWRCAVAGKRERDAWPVVRVGLLRDLAGMSLADIGRREGCSVSMASRRAAQHARLLTTNAAYAARASVVAQRCLGDR